MAHLVPPAPVDLNRVQFWDNGQAVEDHRAARTDEVGLGRVDFESSREGATCLTRWTSRP
jgi:hypothetical protein